MASVAQSVTKALHRVAGFVGGLLPSPPSDEAPPPDIDGRRPTSADLTDAKVRAQMRDGRGAGSNQ
jgi:hypothetical protein